MCENLYTGERPRYIRHPCFYPPFLWVCQLRRLYTSYVLFSSEIRHPQIFPTPRETCLKNRFLQHYWVKIVHFWEGGYTIINLIYSHLWMVLHVHLSTSCILGCLLFIKTILDCNHFQFHSWLTALLAPFPLYGDFPVLCIFTA